MKADLHMYGPIGFQPYWLKVQDYEGKNLAKEIADEAFRKDIGVCAITSEEEEILRGSVHDRFRQLKYNHIPLLSKEYKTDTLGENILIVVKEDKKVYLVNSQSVCVKENGKLLEHSVIGSNEVPNQKNLKDTISYCKDRDLIQIAEHPYCGGHFGMGEERLLENLSEFSAIEGHDSQLIFKRGFSKLPIIGKYNRQVNEEAKKFARRHNKPWIATSNAHKIKDLGISYIEFIDSSLNTNSEEKFFESLKEIIVSDKFLPYCRYEKLTDWINWVSKFVVGINLHKKEV